MEEKITKAMRDDYYWGIRSDYLCEMADEEQKPIESLHSSVGIFRRNIYELHEDIQRFECEVSEAMKALNFLPNVGAPEWKETRRHVLGIYRSKLRDTMDKTINYLNKYKNIP